MLRELCGLRFLPHATKFLLIPTLAACALAQTQSPAPSPSPTTDQVDPQSAFQQGEAALRAGKIDQAERDFRAVLAANPQVAGAYANLGVIYMRREQWQSALEMLRKAEHLAPTVAGVRLNIGLVYYRQDNFRAATSPFESVVRDAPASYQARYLLGLCYFLTERYADAVSALKPLWGQSSNQLNYLYVLGIAAGKAGRADLEQQALGRMAGIGQDSPEMHLLIGKAHINHEEYDDAVKELDLAVRGNE